MHSLQTLSFSFFYLLTQFVLETSTGFSLQSPRLDLELWLLWLFPMSRLRRRYGVVLHIDPRISQDSCGEGGRQDQTAFLPDPHGRFRTPSNNPGIDEYAQSLQVDHPGIDTTLLGGQTDGAFSFGGLFQ
jgi:hypothetical protein